MKVGTVGAQPQFATQKKKKKKTQRGEGEEKGVSEALASDRVGVE